MALPTFAAYRTVGIAGRDVVAQDQLRLRISAPDDVIAQHARAGQFVRARVGRGFSDEGIFAMLSAPFEREIVLLLRTGNPEGGEAADALAALELGDELEMTPPAGDGFALDRARGRPVFVVATGTAIAPARAAIETMLREPGAFGPITLDHGLRSNAHLAIAGDVARWRRAGLAVNLHYSQPTDGGGVEGVLAHDALLERIDDATLRGATFVAVGQPVMVEEVRTRVVLRGGKPEHVLSNY